ncbi:transcription factor KUA1-like isoform X2 [Aristolochia californica]|uniref:transcription factor KUA1-like isoform X2 n=1 Tax=Aristolochia californica TaxID=171875 RepID=UPI0035D89426
MGKDISRKCSHCGNNGHNSRTCNEKGLKLFGVRISGEREDVMRKSKSLGNLSGCVASDNGAGENGYLSDGPVHSSRRSGHERKKGVPWTEEEHRTFLAGLEKLGKGDWRGISRNFVTTKTPTQVASHAQKYFLRQSTQNKRKRRSSLFDMVIRDIASTSETTPAFNLVRMQETPEESSLHHQNNNNSCTSARIAAQTLVRTSEAYPTTFARTGGLSSFHSSNYMVDVNKQATMGLSPVFPTLSLTPTVDFSAQTIPVSQTTIYGPNFLKLSFNPPTQSDPHFLSAASSCSPSTDCGDLELSIAPPRPLNTNKLSRGTTNFSGAIQVI